MLKEETMRGRRVEQPCIHALMKDDKQVQQLQSKNHKLEEKNGGKEKYK